MNVLRFNVSFCYAVQKKGRGSIGIGDQRDTPGNAFSQ